MTINDTVDRSRTAAATEARRLAKSERLVAEVVDRLPEMPRPLLAALLGVILAELERRVPGGP